MPPRTRPPRSLFRSRHRSSIGPPASTPRAAPTIPSGPTARDAGRLAAGLLRIHACTLCGATPARWRGIWRPTPEIGQRLGAPEGRLRVVAWGLCASCREIPDVVGLVEEVILSEAEVALARPESN